MSQSLILHELTPSPNNVKVRIALGYKGLAYDRRPVQFDEFPGDRSEMIRMSRQPRLPILQHGDVTLFDSGAIIRYLETSFPDSPSLFVTDYAAFREMEGWELAARTSIGEPIGMLFSEAGSGKPDPEAIARVNDLFHERTQSLEDALADREFLVGDHMTIADVSVAVLLQLAALTAEDAALHPLRQFFYKSLKLRDGRDRTRAWLANVIQYDSALAGV